METSKQHTLEQRGIAFAVLLLTGGLIWFLYNINLISASGINIVLSLWPLALVALGADLLMRRESPRIGFWIVVAIAVVVLLAALIAPRFGIGVLVTSTNTYTEPLADARSATITLHPGIGALDVRVLDAEDMLFSAEATYIGEVNFDVHGTSQRQIDFGQRQVNTNGWLNTDEDLHWNIGLTPHIPLSLSVNTGLGEANLDLTGLNLTNLTLTSGVGRINLVLPNQDESYQVTVTGGVGDFDVTIPADADMDLFVTGGVGDVAIDVVDETAVRVSTSAGLGDFRVPAWLQQVSTGNNEQVWQSSNFETATRRVNIHVESGLGGLTIR